MNVEKVLQKLETLYPGKPIIQNTNKEGEIIEILCEVEPTSEHTEYSKAIAIIDKSVEHRHAVIEEVYRVVEGELTLYVNGDRYLLQKGDFYVIEPGKRHYAIGDETWVEVTAKPGWYAEDHLIIQNTKA